MSPKRHPSDSSAAGRGGGDRGRGQERDRSVNQSAPPLSSPSHPHHSFISHYHRARDHPPGWGHGWRSSPPG
eukprot:6429032-Pyramimonas_sp.AAC.1